MINHNKKCQQCGEQAVIRIKDHNAWKYYFFCDSCYLKLKKVTPNQK